jgi:hypothetical protein
MSGEGNVVSKGVAFLAYRGWTIAAMNADTVIADTRTWLEEAVIGLNLCPFAKAVHAKGQIRYVVSAATDVEALQQALLDQLRDLATADPAEVDTTLLIHPLVLQDFEDFNQFLVSVW